VITGASAGIGKQISIRVAEEGAARLAICARTESKLLETKKICEKTGTEVLAIPCDIMKLEDIKVLVDKVAKSFGTIDGLINNAHTIATPRSFLEWDEKVLDTEIQSGFYGTWRMTKLCFPLMKDKGGSIVNFGSGVGVNGFPGFSGYGASKEAIRSLTRTLANEWGEYNIRVNVICPSVWTDTLEADTVYTGIKEQVQAWMSTNPLGKLGDPYKHIAPVAVFLLSEDSAWMTGQTFNVEGGIRTYA
jgi:NAD(P)-dependent dehydrogenase (short-subunit alcohol dehydrogenase family)